MLPVVTFVPTPRADLSSLETLEYDLEEITVRLTNLGQQILSRLHWAETADDWAAASIADIYARLPGLTASWLWAPTPSPTANPGLGKMYVGIGTGNGRNITLNQTDADGEVHSLAGLGEGSMIVLTDDPGSPPTTAFRQYVVTAPPNNHGGWLTFPALRVATFGVQDTPVTGSRVRLLLR